MKKIVKGRTGHPHRLIVCLALVVICFLALAPTVSANKGWIINEDALPFDPLPGAEAYWGVHAQAAYRMEVPANWNGDLVLWAHGYVPATNKVLSVQMPSLRIYWISQGYAWAASSYRANGYVPGTGALDTQRLIGLFKGKVGNPKRVYISGGSLGGHVTGVAIEQWPNTFDGALAICGVMGGNDLFDYFQDAYLVAETLVWGNVEVPTPEDYFTDGWPLTRAALGSPFPWLLNPTGELYKAIIKNITGGDRPGFEQGFTSLIVNGAFIFDFGSAEYHGRNNLDTIYRWTDGPEMTPEEQEFNDTIFRSKGLPQFQRKSGLGIWPGTEAVSPPIKGNFRIPVVSLHTLGDMFVPFSMQQSYARRASERGKDHLLAVRAIRGYSHCDFAASELMAAWDDLVGWVEYGIPAEGDNVLDPAEVAQPDFGCNFSANTTLRGAVGLNCP
jgi:hypothetical protein